MGRALRRATAVAVSLVASTLVGCKDDVDIPEGPDLTPLVNEYDSPSGTLDEENVARVAAVATEKLETVESIGDLDFVVDTLNATKDTVEDFAAADGDPDPDVGGTVRVSGVARVRTICPGVTGELDASVNGTLNVNVPFRENRLSPVVFGAFDRCSFRVAREEGGARTIPVLIDSSIAANIGTGVSFELAGLDAVLYRLKGTAKVSAAPTFDLDTDFRTFRDGRVEVRVAAADGDVIPFVNRDTLASGIRTRDADFCCDFGERVCIQTTSSNAKCTEPATGARVLRW